MDMDLSFLIPSKTRRTVLAYFVKNPKAQGGVRELARAMQLPPQLAYREFINLENWGFLFSSKRGNQRAFRLNERFPFYPGMREIFLTVQNENSRRPEIVKTYDWKKLSAHYKKIPIPKNLLAGLNSPRTHPRAYEEEKLLNKKGLL